MAIIMKAGCHKWSSEFGGGNYAGGGHVGGGRTDSSHMRGAVMTEAFKINKHLFNCYCASSTDWIPCNGTVYIGNNRANMSLI